ncbi:hypothetical protein [Floridanema evergladense]|uniref:Uncharacterized protein n=1 Tax=Floridaenema evergladense BLCC-F167 TaxID=3153639 RepID=A0ABV4WVP2_9CYAN
MTTDSPQEPLFQAVGILPGKVTFTEDDKIATVTVSGQKYSLLYIPTKKGLKAFEALKKQVKSTGNDEFRLIVYPRVIHFPKKDKPHQVAFQLVGFDNGSSEGICKALKDFEFKISGLWQFIPVCQVPCISVFKNFTPERLEYVKKSEVYKRVKFMKGSHLPIFWKDAPIRPFRFNPKLDKEEQGKPMFVSIKAKFLPQRNVFGFDSLLTLPQAEIPQFFKASKKMKTEALQQVKEFKKSTSTEETNDQEVNNQPALPKPKVQQLDKPKVQQLDKPKVQQLDKPKVQQLDEGKSNKNI